ncbi:MAG: hypothetical protein NC831_06250 [Candidatus Omnitrophica bacterium]|nr:hypothetical protein [Candidatus Omnitrophota bacterium]MCM8829118.1 hypothetical protein [Candidatus Omnitrophota bacterium]
MKKIFVAVGALCFATGILWSQAESVKDVFSKRIIEKYRDVNEMSAVVEMNMSMMGTTMKMPMKVWVKGKNFRMDMSMVVPGADKNMEQITISDGNTVSTYNNLNNTIMTIDMNKLPEETKKIIKNQYATKSMGFDLEMFEKIKDQIKVEETVRNGRNAYLITVDNIDAIKNTLNMPSSSSQVPFKKLLYIIDCDSLLPVKMEIYADGETPGLWMDFIEIKTSGVPDSIFNVKFPPDARKMDITETVKGTLVK